MILEKDMPKQVFLETSKYDSIIYSQFSDTNDKKLPDSLNINLSKNF